MTSILTALPLADLGFERRGPESAKTFSLPAQHGIRAHPLRIDLALPDAVRRMLDATAAMDVGLVVSNAGFSMKGDHAGNDAAD